MADDSGTPTPTLVTACTGLAALTLPVRSHSTSGSANLTQSLRLRHLNTGFCNWSKLVTRAGSKRVWRDVSDYDVGMSLERRSTSLLERVTLSSRFHRQGIDCSCPPGGRNRASAVCRVMWVDQRSFPQCFGRICSRDIGHVHSFFCNRPIRVGLSQSVGVLWPYTEFNMTYPEQGSSPLALSQPHSGSTGKRRSRFPQCAQGSIRNVPCTQFEYNSWNLYARKPILPPDRHQVSTPHFFHFLEDSDRQRTWRGGTGTLAHFQRAGCLQNNPNVRQSTLNLNGRRLQP